MNRPKDSRSSFSIRFGVVIFCLALLPGSTRCHAAGSVTAWGANESLQSQPPPGLSAVVRVAGGAAHSVALRADGTVAAWGQNSSGQSTVPTSLTGVTSIGAGSDYSLALRGDGTMISWGGQIAVPGGLSNVMAIAAGWTHALALKRDGTLVSWGSETNVPEGLTNVVGIAAGDGQSLAVLANGQLVAWGNNAFAKAIVPPDATNVQAVAAGGDHSLALLGGGIVLAWGRNDFGQATVPPDLTNVVAISAGALHSLALRADGTVVAWGNNRYGQASPPSGGTGLSTIGAGAFHSLAAQGDNSPVILIPPLSQTAFVSADVALTVSAVGQQPLTFQWQHNSTDVSGANSPALILRNVQPGDAGTYRVKVQNALGTITSPEATLSIIGGIVDAAPQDQTVVCGDNTNFSVSVRGPARFDYQWYFQSQELPGATQTTLVLTNVTPGQAGLYSVTVSNRYYSTNIEANLAVTVEPPHITSLLTTTGTQGRPFRYSVQATHSPVWFAAEFLPAGLFINPTNGIISGTPGTGGVFYPVLTVSNACAWESQLLTLTISDGAPVILGPSAINGAEGTPVSRQITATGSPTSFGGENLPPGIAVDPVKGIIFGTPVYPGTWSSTVWATNTWGAGQRTVSFSFTNAPIDNLSIENVTYNYSAPYLLDFQFSLYTLSDTNDPASAHGVVVNPRLLSALCLEDDLPTGSETGAQIVQSSSRLNKTYLVLDFTESVASPRNGDNNNDGISDAVDGMVNGAISFAEQQPADSQLGVYEFHREDQAPSKVLGLTSDKSLVAQSIAGIWTNYVQGFPASSRCWDAAMAAIKDLGTSNRDEQHFVVLISDGRDESSSNTLDTVITAATNNGVKVFCVGFGSELETNSLQTLSAQTQGKYHTATNVADLVTQFARLAKDSRGQYILRWATLKRGSNPKAFMPSFQIAYQGLVANSPTNPWYMDTNNPIVDTNSTPPTTNYNNITNFIIGYYVPASNAGPVTVGSLRLVANAEVSPTGVDLRASYVPRYIRQLRLHYRANWPCTAELQSTQPGEFLSGWSLSETNDGAGGNWLLLSSANPKDLGTSVPFASFGKLVTFTFQDVINPSNAFSIFEIDNTLYTNTGGQSFAFENTNAFRQYYPVMPHGTPVPWLIAAGYSGSGSWTLAEELDPDGDGVPNWQEYQANTDPKNAASRFILGSVIRQPDGRFQIVFTSALNRSYKVEASTDLVSWVPVRDALAGTGQDVTVIDTRGVLFTGTIYYRVLVY